MHDTRRPPESPAQPVPEGGALGLLALGYRGLEAWREARGRDWIEDRRREWDAARPAPKDAEVKRG